MSEEQLRSYVVVDLGVIKNNYMSYRAALPPSQEIIAVVKADAYGHGAVKVAKALESVGCKLFAAADIDEAISLREAGVAGEILVLGYTSPRFAHTLIENDLTQTIVSEEHAKQFIKLNEKVKCQIAVDTGMNRVGIDGSAPAFCEKVIRASAQNLRLTGLYTHFCSADDDKKRNFTLLQAQRFDQVLKRVNDLNLKYVHCANSAASLSKANIGNAVRLGAALYGLKTGDVALLNGVKAPLEWKSVITKVKKVKAGQTVGYGRAFTANNDITVATVSTGYADGYSRLLSNKGEVVVRGERAKIIGLICMDAFMADVSAAKDVKTGDEVALIGDGVSADDLAGLIGTIGYEVVCRIGKRVKRYYKE